jgi:hypothetical protein
MHPRTVVAVVAGGLVLGCAGAARADHDTDADRFFQVDLGARWAGGNQHLPVGSYALHLGGLYHHGRADRRPGLLLGVRLDKYLGARDDANGLVAQGTIGLLRIGRISAIQHQFFGGFRHVTDVLQTGDEHGPIGSAGGAVLGYHFQYGSGILQAGGELEVVGYLYGAAGRTPVGIDLRVHGILDLVVHLDWVTGAELGLGFAVHQTWL